MRIFFSATFITLTLLVGAVGVAPTAHAQGPSLVDQLNADQADQAALENAIQSADALPSGVYSATANVKTDPKLKGAEEGFGTIMIWIMSLFAWLVGVAALLLDYTVYFTVVKMGSYVNDLSAIGVTWRVLRDIGNIMLIFGFLAAGIATILNTEFYGWKTKMLPMLLVAAVFINFSLFISEAIVDTGNLFATQFYTQINGGDPAGAKQLNTNFSFSSGLSSGEGISSKLMGQLGLQSIYGEVSNTEKAAKILEAGNSWVIGFMGVILFMVTAFVMFSLAFILIARFVALVFLLIVAPIGFAGLAIPGFAARAKQWWTTLLEQTITAPILLLMLYIALAVITDAQFLTGFCLPGESTITGAVNTNTTCTVNPIGWVSGNFQGFASFILSFLVAIGLLLAVIVYAKRWSAFGGDWASRTAGKLTFGATAWAGRTSVGWVAHKTSRGLQKIGVGSVPLVGTGLVKGFNRIATGSFDVRGTGALKNIPFGSSIVAGEAQKGGYRADLKSRTESRTKYAGELVGMELNDTEKAEQAALHNEIKRLQKDRGRATAVAEIQKIDADIKTTEGRLGEIEKWTDKGQQRRYASALNLWRKPDKPFNKWFNFAANTEAAKIIRTTAKKGKPDKDWSSNMKKLLEEAAKESGEEAGAGTAPTTSPPVAPTAPPPGPAASTGGGTPPTP